MSEKQESIGAFWIKNSKKGLAYLSGIIELGGKKLKVVAFQITSKQKENQPDWRLYLQAPYEKKEPETNQEKLNEIDKDELEEIPF